MPDSRSCRLFAIVFLLSLAIVSSSDAATYTQSLTGSLNWTNPSWSCTPGAPGGLTCGAYPGNPSSAAGDVANVTIPNTITLTVDTTLSFPVTLGTTGAGTIAIPVAGGLPLTGASAVSNNTRLQISGGTLNNAGTLLVGAGGMVVFQGGTFSGAGTTTLAPNGAGPQGILSFTGFVGGMTLTGQQVVSSGTIDFSSPTFPLSINSGAVITNNNAISVGSDNTINSDLAGGAKIINNSILQKTGGTGSSIFNVPVNNAGTATMIAGGTTMEFRGGGTHSGTFDFGSGGVAYKFGSTNVFNAPATFTGPGLVELSNGTFTLNTDIVVSQFTEQAGTLNGPNNLTINSQLNWNGGSMAGTGTTLLVSPTGTGSINGPVVLDARTFTLGGSITWGGLGAITVQNNANFNIPPGGVLTIQNDVPFQASGLGTLHNQGLIVKNPGTGVTAFNNLTFINDGNLLVSTGTLQFAALGAGSGGVGTWDCGPGTCSFLSGTVDLNAGSNLTGNGVIAVSGGTVNVNGSFTSSGQVNVNGGTLNVNVASTIPTMTLSAGTLGGSGAVTISNLTWSNGVMKGPGQTTATTTNVSTSVNCTLDQRQFTNSGTFTFSPTPTGQLVLINGSAFNNDGNFDATADGSIVKGAGANFIHNVGIFQKLGGAAALIVQPDMVNVAPGRVQSQSGTIELDGTGSSSSGLFTVTIATATIDVNSPSASLAFLPGASVAGPGTIRLINGTISIQTSLLIPNFEEKFGVLTGPSTLQIDNLIWSGGQMTGTGVTTISGSGTALFNNTINNVLDQRQFINNGTVTYSGPAPLFIQNGANLTNNSMFDAQFDGSIQRGGTGGVINNSGTFQKSAGSGQLFVQPDFLNSGTLQSSSGSIVLQGLASQSSGTFDTTTPSATIDLNFPTATLTFNNPAQVTGTGKLRVIAGTMSAAATALTVANFVQSGGVVTGPGVLTITTFDWTGGSMQGTGSTIVTNTNYSGALNIIVDQRSFQSDGTFSFGGTGSFFIQNNALFTNNGVFNATADGTIANGAGTNGFDNVGTFSKSGGAGSLSVQVPLFQYASGFVTVSSGTIGFTNGFTDNGGQIQLNVATVAFTLPQTLTGTLSGNGNVNGVFTNNGFINPGIAGAGKINFSSDYTQGPGGHLNIELGGTTAGTQFDQINVAGNVFLGGTLNVSLINGYTPGPADSLTIMTFAGRPTGADFASKNGIPPSLTPTYTPTSLVLAAIAAAPADVSITKSGAATIVNGGTIVYGLNIVNGGTGPATNVVATDVLPANVTFNSVSSSAGTSCTNSGNTITCTTATLAAGFSATASITVTPNAPGTYNNTASVTANEPDPDLTNNTSNTVTTTVLGTADMAITKTSPASVSNGQTFSYTIVVTNNGPDTATGVTVNDPLPPATFVSAASTQGTCTNSAGALTCNVGTLALGASATITLTMTPTFVGGLTNTATVSRNEVDSNSTNDSATANTAVGAVNDLSISKTDSPDPVAAGGTLTYTINVTNAGPDGAALFHVMDPLPAGVTFVSASGGSTWNCSFAAGTVTCDYNSSLAPGFSAASITIVVLAPTAAGTLNNTAQVSLTSPDADPNSANNIATQSTLVTGGGADLAITKTGPGNVTAGQNVTYNFTVLNNGPSNVVNAIVNDSPGPGLTFVSATTCASFPCVIPTLNAGTSVTFTATYAVSPSATGSASNTADVTAGGVVDPVPANNTSTTTATVVVNSDLSITKTGPASAPTGSTIAYTFTLTNAGPSNSANVVINDPTPAGTTFLSSTAPCATGFPCTLATAAVGTPISFSATYSVTATSGSITNTVAIASPTDTNTTNNTATVTTAITATGADLQIVKTGPSAIPPGGGAMTFNITVKNLGPAAATNLFINDSPSAGLAFSSNSGACTTPFPCSVASLAAGAQITIQSTFMASAGISRVTNTADVSASTTDPVPSNNVSTVIVGQACPNGTITQFAPAPNQQDAPVSGVLQFSAVGATSYQIFLGPAGSGCSTLVATITGNSYNYSGLSPNTDYESRIVAIKTGCSAITSQCVKWRTGAGPCNLATPQLQQPASGTTAGSPTTLKWSAVGGADTYHVVAIANGQTILDVTTRDTFVDVTLPNGGVTWSVTAISGNCASAVANGQFNVCAPPEAPLAGVVGAPTSGNAYSVLVVNPSTNNVLYEFQESTNDSFNNALTQSTSSPSVAYTHSSTTPQVFFYRVRAFAACTTTPGPYSKTVRVVIVPASTNSRNPSINVPFGAKGLVVVQVQIPGESTPVNFSATADRPWVVKIEPSSGVLPTAGIAVNVTIDPSQLPNGTFTATIIVTTSPIGGGNSRLVGNANGKSVPVSINLVTPVVPNNPTGPTADSLIIPAVGHLAGLNSQWRSDIRIYNASPQALQYLLNFRPQGSNEVKQTTITTASGDTTALDDIIHNWFGVGEVGDSATGVLEIRPMTTDGSTTPPKGGSFLTVASSRTFNATSDGTVGQFIPPVKFTNFIGAGSKLSMQQLAQSNAYRTNFGLVEASGAPVNLILSMFNDAGSKLFDLPVALNAGEQKLLNGLLQQQGVSVNDGRMELKVDSGAGKVTAYASVIDNASLDPQLVPGQNLTNTTSKLYVVPGVADLNNGGASWRTDMRIYNSGSSPQTTELVFYPEDKAGAPVFATITVNPNEVKAIDGILQSLFSTRDAGGMVQATTATDSQLVITARTYNQTSTGTLGQFIKAATAADGVTANSRSLNILQVEDSPRFRTNVGLAEMTGKPATVEVSVILPDSKVTPSIQVPLAANEFRQFSVAQFGLGNIYNARVSVKVVDGPGSVTAYGSVIDQVTTDPTFVAAQ